MSKYTEAGVNLEQSDSVKEKISDLVSSTFGPNVLSSGGEFGGIFRIPDSRFSLVASIDGVGTKLKVAVLAGKHDTIGQDLVNHCVNDIGVMGATPAFFLDYLATGLLDQNVILDIIQGMVQACKEKSIALIGGETAQMPGMYSEGEYDLAGAIVGFVEKSSLLPTLDIQAGDILIGFKSNGLHTNGYSLARDIVFRQNKWDIDTYDDGLGRTWGEELLRIHKSYLSQFKELNQEQLSKAFAHITGGGLPGNIIRVLPPKVEAIIDSNRIPEDSVFSVLMEAGEVSVQEMYQVFNMGIGMVAIASPHNADKILSMYQEDACYVGECREIEMERKVTIIY